MGDQELRRLERAWLESGSAEDERRLLQVRLRREQPDRDLLTRLLALTPAGDPDRARTAAALLPLVDEATDRELNQGWPGGARRLGGVLLDRPPGQVGLRGWHVANERPCAVELCPYWWAPPLADDEIARFMARSERLEHPNLARLIGWGRDPVPHLVIDWGDATRPLPLAGPTPPAQALAWCEQVARALGAGHAAGLVHAELTPAGVQLTPDGRAVIEPFGRHWVRQYNDGNLPAAMPLSLPWPDYMSPALAQGRPPSPACDVFAVGVLAHHLLLGRSLFRREGVVATLAAVLLDPVPPLRTLLPAANAELERVLGTALDRGDGGYPSAGLLADALASAAARLDEPDPSPPLPPPPPPPPPPKPTGLLGWVRALLGR